MTGDEKKKTAIRFLCEALPHNRADMLGELCVNDLLIHWRDGTSSAGLPEAKAFLEYHDRCFSDFSVEVKDIVAEGDKVAVRIVQSGTHAGSWEGSPATGKRWSIWECVFFLFGGGKIAEIWALPDIDGRKMQLGFQSVPPER